MNRNLSALIVDDEEKAVKLLGQLLEDTQQFSKISSATSAAQAHQELGLSTPDLIFLDVKMPGKDGFSFLKDVQVKKVNTEIVFVTAYDGYALQALRNHAFGYLLKPVNRKELNECLEQFRERKITPDFLDRLGKFIVDHEESNRLRFNTRAGYFFVDPADILYCRADGNYSCISTGEKEHLCSLQLGVVQEMLPKNGFVRLGRSLIVNFKYIARVDRKKHLLVFEKQGTSYPVSVSPLQLKELERKQVG